MPPLEVKVLSQLVVYRFVGSSAVTPVSLTAWIAEGRSRRSAAYWPSLERDLSHRSSIVIDPKQTAGPGEGSR